MHEAVVVRDDMSGKSDRVASDLKHHDATRFSGYVARTSSELACFVDQNSGQFPFSTNKKRSSEEGAFEEGAVVCAPADIQSWKSSSDGDEDRLQIPHPSVSSYFIEDSSGHCALQIPEDPALLLSHRWPIGSVTTGFVRGR